MHKYIHGGNIYGNDGIANKKIIDFSANVNPLGISEEILKAARDSIAEANIYPDSRSLQLTSKLANFEEVDKTSILCSNGASDILFRLVFAIKPKKVLITAPSFSDYERAGKAVGAEIVYHILKRENNFSINTDENFINTLRTTSPDIVFLCNPNNPTGNLINRDVIERILVECKSINSILLVDECFLDFVTDSSKYSAKAFINKYPNLLVLKAFTKIFAIPALRLGYAVCSNKKLIDHMQFCGADWSVSNIAQSAGITALKNGKEFINNSVTYINIQRELMAKKLIELGLVVYPSYANFIFFYCKWDIDLHKELLKNNILIRDCSNFKGLEANYYRTAILKEDKNIKLIQTLKGVMNHGKINNDTRHSLGCW